MVIDVHSHIFPDETRNNREKFFDGEPEFTSIYKSSKAKMVSYQETVKMMDEQGVDKAVIFGFPWNNVEFAKINNDYVIEAVKRFPERFIGLCCLNPLIENAEEEVKRCFSNGLKGVGEIAFYHSDITYEIIEKLEKIMKLCYEANYPFLIHTNEPVGHEYPGKVDMKLKSIYNFLKKYPENKIILAHMGGGIFFYTVMKKEVSEVLKNTYFDTAAVPFLYKKEIYKIAYDFAGEDKILFGSDYPLINPSRYFKDMDEISLNEDLKKKIKGENARKLFNC